MKDLLEATINWKKAGPATDGKPVYLIENAELDSENKSLNISIVTNFEIPRDDILRISLRLRQEKFGELANINLKIKKADITEGIPLKPLFEEKKEETDKKESVRQYRRKKIEGNIIEISEVEAGQKEAIVCGKIFKVEKKVMKSDRFLLTILINDKSGSTCIKKFTTEKELEKLEKTVKIGNVIKVRGTPEFSEYDNATTIIAREIEVVKTEKRKDNAKEKRIELHAHTKMSAMDGIADTIELIETAADFGHEAIAITDHGVVQAFPEAMKAAQNNNIKVIYGLEGYLIDNEEDYKKQPSYHIILLCKNQKGLHNLYRLVTSSHIDYFYRRPRLPRSLIEKYRDGLIIGSACEAGEVYQAVLKDKDYESLAKFYDYLEIQPLGNNRFMVDDGIVNSEEDLIEINKKIISTADKLKIPVVATGDVHYIEQDEAIYRQIIMAGQGYKDVESNTGLFFRTTEEMLDEFHYLSDEDKKRLVITNPKKISDMVEEVKPIADGNFPPEIKDADIILRQKCMENAEKIYGKNMHEKVRERLEKELSLIIDNDFAVLYVSAGMLVKESLKNGYLVGSRGSVGSSLVATMFGITEVNPLPPHYICENENCRHTEFSNEKDCGIDLPEKKCEICGSTCRRDGFNIPFEVFLGFPGNEKVPDIDLNFAGEYQASAHKYLEQIFGKENIFRAGTIGTIKDKTAFGFVKKYLEETQKYANKWEIERLAINCTGTRRTTGQHPGGIIILQEGHEITEFCPVQYPANNRDLGIITTHFDYHSIEHNLLKLDILGHDVPSIIRMLHDITDVDPLTIPLDDEDTNSIFNGVEALNIIDEDYRYKHGSFGVPEFGTNFVRGMLDDVKPSCFSDLIRISGLSHGENVWTNNAKDLVSQKIVGFSGVISTRDDIMNYLIERKLPPTDAFYIMESVRKGKGLTPEQEKQMREHDVPEWYIDSCKKITYMFPKAHAVAYVLMSYRIAYYKVHYPLAFYTAFFSMKVADFNHDVIMAGEKEIEKRINEIEAKGWRATLKETAELTVLEVAYEMMKRGYAFSNVCLKTSKAAKFMLREDKTIQLPLSALNGLGEAAATAIEIAREERYFMSVDDLVKRTKLNVTAVGALRQVGALDGLSETNQITWEF